MNAPAFALEAQKQPRRAKVRRGGWSWGRVEGAKLRVLSLGAGVQSTTLALMAAHGEIGPMPDLALFADTGDETRSTMDTLAWLQGGNVLPFEVRVVSRGDRLSDSFARRADPLRVDGDGQHFVSAPFFTGNGGQAPRQCTRHYKVDVLKAEQRRLAGLKPRELAIRVVETWIGISTDEVIRAGAAFDRWAVNRFPLLEARMSRSDCILWLERHGYPIPAKSACTFCPYRLNAEWHARARYRLCELHRRDHPLEQHRRARRQDPRSSGQPPPRAFAAPAARRPSPRREALPQRTLRARWGPLLTRGPGQRS